MAALFNLKITQEMERNPEEERRPAKCTRNQKKKTVRKGKGKNVEEQSATLLERMQDTQCFSIRMPRLEEELAMSKQENKRLKCRVLQLEEENKSLRDHISQKNVAESSTKKKEKEEEKPVKQPTPAPAGTGPSSMVRRIKMGARKRNIVKQVENAVYTNKRKKNFSGKNAVTNSECERIQHFLSNIKYFGPQKFEINNAECFGMDISDMIMGNCTCSRIIDVYMEIIKRNYHLSGVKGVYTLDCGIFMLKAMEKISMDQEIDFKKKDISRLRCEMAVEILTSNVRG